ncbi:hypothetical protein [uncultured Desulfobacter sp.]|uniref:hypothetical protein n=1 Tax=uncultured Desulfobacter sp. TaxID=240139 RepID=UPI0029F5A714|nr:hypothetical protein [uncultured Desulfobacter sp.]
MVFSGEEISFERIATALERVFAEATRRKISMEEITSVIPGTMGISKEEQLLSLLEKLDAKGKIRLPSKKGQGWQRFGILPRYITLVRADEDRVSRKRKKTLARIREQSPWEPMRMAAFAHTLTTEKQLTLARAVNHYLLNRKTNPPLLPHRERALQICGNEKALDSYVHTGLFSGRITLADIDCFYCPEPLPYEVFAGNRRQSAHLPLLVVENSATYWSCAAANRADHPLGGGFFAAVVFGKGFKATKSTPIQSLDSLANIESQTGASRIDYFGDLDPAGLTIPQRINENRIKNGLSRVYPAKTLYRKLIKKNLTTGYDKSQTKFHDPQWAIGWLGRDIADNYLDVCESRRWPQEGLTADDIAAALKEGQSHSYQSKDLKI